MNAVLDPDHDPRQNADDNEPTAADPYSSSQAPRRSLSRTNRVTGAVHELDTARRRGENQARSTDRRS
ncbi:hypothetical protein VDGL01_04211 [Verticillium dahliae]